jgi:hypothetical protein
VFAFTQTHKLYRDGAFFELANDLGETHPLRETELQEASREIAAGLRAALNRFKGIRQAGGNVNAER